MTKIKNITVAQDTIKICQDKKYLKDKQIVSITHELDAAIDATTIYYPTDDLHEPHTDIVPRIEVVNETTADASFRLLQEGKLRIVALNFASATSPGGGFLTGSNAQEEDLCRASGLYFCLQDQLEYYDANIQNKNYLYTDHIIYSPSVPFFKDYQYNLLDQPFPISIITAPAPCLINVKDIDQEILYNTIYRRALKILQVAHIHNHKHIVLGAWGCGAFQNDPVMVANIFKKALEELPAFETVVFAVYDTRNPPYLYETFKSILNG